jgi:rhamnose utilization protein RhaD (predicted bifunctional aldolase and dehydrogenase)
MSTEAKDLNPLLELSHQMGSPALRMAILGEGNSSLKLNDETFAVKASGTNLEKLQTTDVAICRFDKLLPLFNEKDLSDAAIDKALFDSRVDSNAKKPSIEALFHAWLLTLPGVNCVGHVHAIAVNQILCSPRAKEFATQRLFPDEVVLCGTESVLVPYVDPGLSLAKAIRDETLLYIRRTGREPKVILLKNHGIIAVGSSPKAVMGTLLMAEKSAQIFVGAATLGGPDFMSAGQVERIAGRPDEHYRQKMLGQ